MKDDRPSVIRALFLIPLTCRIKVYEQRATLPHTLPVIMILPKWWWCLLTACLLVQDSTLVLSKLINEDIEDNSITKEQFNNDSSPSLSKVPERSSNELDNELPKNVSSSEPDKSSGTSGYVIRMLSRAFKFLNLKQMVRNVQQGKSTPGACIACKFAMTMVRYLIDYGKGFKDVAFVTTYFCKSLNVQTARVCEGYVNNFMVSTVL